jgi:hypothetical protein
MATDTDVIKDGAAGKTQEHAEAGQQRRMEAVRLASRRSSELCAADGVGPASGDSSTT